ncbi:hypothetical protein Goarm_009673 [Gossypium armourianum]|uniref:Uncharacterized protein n=1 Tax=Gossypium armourianum TaxID=34283 RepID=A0A7J9JTK8_9ROSI|nr:hypothetical protein [Gossypium armourianum]
MKTLLLMKLIFNVIKSFKTCTVLQRQLSICSGTSSVA